MSRSSEAVKRWRERTKKKIIEAMGGKCCVCGYDKCFAAFDLHHLEPDNKDLQFGKVTANPKAWEKIVIELRKCVLICSRCHREVHHGYTIIPDTAPKFNESYIDSKKNIGFVGSDEMDQCPFCPSKKPVIYKTCSRKCAAKLSWKTDWETIDLLAMKKRGLTNAEIGDKIGVSNAAVWKRLKKLLQNQLSSSQVPAVGSPGRTVNA